MANFTPAGVEAVVQGLGKFQSDLGKMNKSISNSGKGSGIAGKSFSKMGTALAGVGTIAAGAVVAGVGAAAVGVVALGVAGIKSASELEQQMANIAAVMGKTQKEIEPLNDLILKLGIDPGLKVSP